MKIYADALVGTMTTPADANRSPRLGLSLHPIARIESEVSLRDCLAMKIYADALVGTMTTPADAT
jgi:hypothetical protein